EALPLIPVGMAFYSLGVRNSLHLHDVAGLAYPQLTIFQFRLKQLAFILSGSFNVKILVALPDGEGSGPWKEFMAEDFCDEDVLGHVFRFKAVAAESGVGASQVAWFPGKGEGAEGSRNVLWGVEGWWWC